MTTQIEMINAAASIAALIPVKLETTGMIDRTNHLVHHVFESAAITAYRLAAQECFNNAYDLNRGELNFHDTHRFITSNHINLNTLIDMCTTGYNWGGFVTTQ